MAVYDVTREDESAPRRLGGRRLRALPQDQGAGLHADRELVVWTYVLDAYEGGLPSASYLGVLADAAEAADAPADYVAALRGAALPVDRALG